LANGFTMLKNYLKIGFRNLLKNRLFTAINISGMAISIASFLVITLFVYDEFQYDKHIEDAHLKYRVYNDQYNADGFQRKGAMIPPMVTPTMQAELPEVESYARFMNFNTPVLFENGNLKFPEGQGGYADPAFLKMFSLKLIEGDPNTALKEPNMVAINRTLKHKYFGDKQALGETIQIFDQDFKVSAVFEDFPAHSHLQLNYFIAMEYIIRAIPERLQSWRWNQFHSYVQLKPGVDPQALEAKMKALAERHMWPATKEMETYSIPRLMPVQDIHLHASDQVWDIAVRGNAQTVYILSATAAFILVIAILNFINLSTARAVARVKEVGVRKVVGAFRSQLIYQFISESIIVSFIALLIGGLMAELVLPALNSFAEKNIPYDIFFNPLVILALFATAVFVGVAAGGYPAFYISGYKPAHILSNKQSGRSGKTMLRKGMVVVQFILSFILIMASLIVSEQHRYLRTKDMGFNKDNVVAVQLRGEMESSLEATKHAFESHPGIISASFQYGLPGEAFAGDGVTDVENGKDVPISMLLVDHDYIKTLGLKLIAGRDFDKNRPSDLRDAFIVSEQGAKALGHVNPEDALEHRISWNRWDVRDSLKVGKIVGVVKDFHLNSLKENITPIILHIFPQAYSSLTFRIKGENIPETIEHLEATWKKFNSEWPFEYRFLDDNFDKLYKSEEKLAVLFTFFTGFAIFVACLGLFGLVVYSTSQKYKEISIRKVLGAPETSLIFGLSKSYMILIAIAFVIAIPVSYYYADQWLQKFAYHIDVTPMLFIKAALLIASISLLTVGIQSFKAARANPVDALKEQ
ncbi:MAG TPA: FtsX-like permease family protein, partial [Chryseosolibacter sp.]